MQWIK